VVAVKGQLTITATTITSMSDALRTPPNRSVIHPPSMLPATAPSP
jgi:hypothetical protein